MKLQEREYKIVNGRMFYNKEFRKNYKEIQKLNRMFKKAGHKTHLKYFMDGYQLHVVGYEEVFDVIEHFGSYGHEQDLLEIMGLYTEEEMGDSVLGDLTAQDIFTKFNEVYKEGGK